MPVLAGHMLVGRIWRAAAVSAALALATLALAACGRTGPLEPPPGPAGQPMVAAPPPSSPMGALLPNAGATMETPGTPMTAEAAAAASKNGFDTRGNPVAASGPQRPFLLDPLLQ